MVVHECSIPFRSGLYPALDKDPQELCFIQVHARRIQCVPRLRKVEAEMRPAGADVRTMRGKGQDLHLSPGEKQRPCSAPAIGVRCADELNADAGGWHAR